MPIVTASKKGQIVIPKDIRKKLHIAPGKRFLIRAERDHVILTPLPDDPVDSFCGFFQAEGSLTKPLLEERKKDKTYEEKKSAG
ncbi:Transcriptional regulator, AbrB family (fragment) [uncultured Desulfobacterium sp.]|uniref:Transcriptional regulator, AbrB family n=1 Tax=uncultured Desulfobacterium sp. TaxID=201089 RepID=A0A445MUQ4_9BACT